MTIMRYYFSGSVRGYTVLDDKPIMLLFDSIVGITQFEDWVIYDDSLINILANLQYVEIKRGKGKEEEGRERRKEEGKGGGERRRGKGERKGGEERKEKEGGEKRRG